MLQPNPNDYCQVPTTEPPRLLVVIDTEEEFDWSARFSRHNTSVQAMRWIGRVQDIFDAYHITPVYVIDYPVASQPDGYRPLQEIHTEGRCLIGAHLHPWVNPPFVEAVNAYNSFSGNLPGTLEATKLRILSDTIAERFGEQPIIYKAGRYGVGSRTAEILEEEGYEVDLSICPHMDFTTEGGPDFTHHSVRPYWFGKRRRLLELPLTVGFTGMCRRWGDTLHRIASRVALQRLHAVGLLARLRCVNRVWLSPEGYRLEENIALLRALYADGVRIFSCAFHSPSVDPGHTPYVTSQRDLDHFLSHCRKLFDFFMGELGGCPTTPLELKAQLLGSLTPRRVLESV
ncbi:MAG: polysaccharide deacetylase family protein [Candidatus Tectomicrobia bacterium]